MIEVQMRHEWMLLSPIWHPGWQVLAAIVLGKRKKQLERSRCLDNPKGCCAEDLELIIHVFVIQLDTQFVQNTVKSPHFVLISPSILIFRVTEDIPEVASLQAIVVESGMLVASGVVV